MDVLIIGIREKICNTQIHLTISWLFYPSKYPTSQTYSNK